ncbi:hypothetical protein Sjap_022886 [Stephania japonica]|uniref:Uncharacterized protein n=1 Tax=Stephania japonica TaxID=461633 RepID=A0AAP0EYI1_9MAGN
MDAIFRARRSGPERSGGKITRGRRIGAAPSPYARPTLPPPPPPPENTRWLLGFVGPATWTIASGAGRLISSLFRSDSSGSSSSEDDGSSTGSSSGFWIKLGSFEVLLKGGFENSWVATKNGSEDEISEERGDNLNQIDTEKNAAKIAIEQLIRQETFTRDECDRLTRMIQSRVVEYTDAQKEKDALQNEFYDRTIGSNYEFPRAFQSGLLGRASPTGPTRSFLANEFDPLSPRSIDLGVHSPDFHNTAVAEAEIGSPVLVAKSYMRTRSPWGSPLLNNVGLKSPSAIWTETPHSLGGHSFSSQFLKRKSLEDSWDALDGARRVRFKQGEGVSIKSSVLELERRISPASLILEKGEVEVGVIADDIERLAANGVLPSGQSVAISDKTQDIGGERWAEEEEVTASVTNEPTVPVVGQPAGPPGQLTEVVGSEVQFRSTENLVPVLRGYRERTNGSVKFNIAGPRSPGGSSSNHIVETRSRDKVLTNGFPLSTSSLPAASNGESSLRNESNKNEGDSNSHSIQDGKLSKSIPIEETCELLSETSVDIPVIDDTDSLASGSHDSSRHIKEAPKIGNKPVPNRAKVKKGVPKQHDNRVSKYSRRIRGRGN